MTILVTSAVLTVTVKTANVKNLQSSLETTTTIYDSDNNKAGEIYSQRGTFVKFDQISQPMKDAVLSAEDRNFYSEYGFSFSGILRAILLNAKNRLSGSSAIAGGGSTLTQQLAKNAYLGQEQTASRKITEIFYAIQIENTYSKNDILTMYLNNAYFGNGVYGVQDAAKAYFNVDAKDLTISQSAMIAGMLQNPTTWNPVTNPDDAKYRRDVVLDTMVTNKKITEQQAAQAKTEPTSTNADFSQKTSYQYPWYFDAVINEAISKYGLTEDDVLNRGYKIYTSLNQKDQTNLQNDYNNTALFPIKNDQSASIVLDAKTGGVRAVVGGRGDHVFRGFNRANQAARQPGSTIKPIAVYSPAIENGYTPSSSLPNLKTTFAGNYSPQNATGYYSRTVTMTTALQQSYNIPAVSLLDKMGVSVGFDSAKKFGLPVVDEDKNLALALGGMTKGVSLQQMAQAYTAFANGGQMNEAHYITKIVDSNGNEIVSKPKVSTNQVISSGTARTMTSMLLGVYTQGTGSGYAPTAGYKIAGKTGITEDVNNAGTTQTSKDQWAIAYTPDVVIAGWQGYDEDTSGNSLPLLLGQSLGPLMKKTFDQVLPNTPLTSFSAQPVTNSDNSSDSSSQSSSSSSTKNSSAIDNIETRLSDTWNNLQQNFEDGWTTITQKANDLWQSFSNGVQNNVGQ